MTTLSKLFSITVLLAFATCGSEGTPQPFSAGTLAYSPDAAIVSGYANPGLYAEDLPALRIIGEGIKSATVTEAESGWDVDGANYSSHYRVTLEKPSPIGTAILTVQIVNLIWDSDGGSYDEIVVAEDLIQY